ncbi:helix-turn-helix domain-containing protein [Micromonospora sp. NPDC004704]
MNVEMWIRALKAARASAGASQEHLASLIKWSPSTIAAIETGRRRPTEGFAEAADDALQTGGLLAELLANANHRRSPTWFEDWRWIEDQATRLREFHPCLVPGLLQTEAYARAFISSNPQHTPERIEELVAARLDRQALLTGEQAKTYVVVIDEFALHRMIGGKDVRKAQLEHLIHLAGLPNISLHVIPVDAGAYPGMAGAFILATLPEGDVAVWLETSASGQVADQPAVVDSMQGKWDALLGAAMPQQISLAILKKAAGEL